MISSGNDWTVFFKGPICGTLMAGSVIALSYPFLREFIAAAGAPLKGPFRVKSDEAAGHQ